MRKRNKTILLILLFLICSRISAQDIEIKDFRQNVTSQIGSVNPIYDKTGQACAVIRFSVRDTTFVVEGNMGVMMRNSQIGEIIVYVPSTTKRLTIRCEGMLPLRYDLPMKLEPKKTYDAYLLAMKTPEQHEDSYEEDAKENEPDNIVNSDIVIETSSRDTNVKKPDMRLKKHGTKASIRPMIGLGYQVMALFGPTISVGVNMNHHLMELSGTIGLKKSDELHLYDSDHNLIATRQYSPSKVQLRYGYGFSVANIAKNVDLSIAPVIGGSLNVFNSKTEADEYREYFKRASSVSLTPGVRASAQVGDHLLIHMTPEFALGVYKSKNCKVISNSNKNFKKWTDGFNLSLGINYIF